MVENEFYICNSYYDSRFHLIRILISYNPIKTYNFSITDKNNDLINNKIVLYDKCIKSEDLFQLKYGNILVKSNNVYNYLYIHFVNNTQKIIVNKKENATKKYLLTWCLTSLRNNYDAYTQFNDTISLSIKYKVDRIVLYYSDVSIRIKKLIKKYQSIGIIKSYYWKENKEICNMKICGKLLQLNDCFYKSIYNSEYILNVDIDEIIIPKIHSDYLSLLKWSSYKYSFANMFMFYTKLCIKSYEMYFEERKTPNDYFKLREVKDASIYNIRNCCTVSVVKSACSKYIIKPTRIEALWLHDIWSGEYNYTIIPINIAYTRHTRHLSYGLSRVCFNYSQDEIKKYL